MQRIKSILDGRDCDVLNNLFNFYSHPDGKVVDLTCNKKRMWKGLNCENVIFCDIDSVFNPDIICSYDKTPFKDNDISVIVWDPPHLPLAAGSSKSLKHFVDDYGLNKSVHGDNISNIFFSFLNEAQRILMKDGLIFVKLIDFVHNHKHSWTLVDFINAVHTTKELTPCDLIIKKDPSSGNLASGKWKKCHHSRISHCWWIVVRKGRCEPKMEYESNNIGRKL